ncbi:hypothetical protein D9619_000808 [Psilocybe cf. subviscida]|uniref:Uncharacterized protein n=1 Tax=Psilocybe cf. subviscida TaxID=2480587 RepID=A0A8H5F3D0_9AGAR|nr:hypothetical protein D9619_000808 [Psilocybe cf. subviscida]
MLLHLRGPVYIHRNIRRRRFLNIPTMIGSTFATHSTEIVYDSEPERIQVRVDRRQRKLQKLKAAPPDDPSTERTRNVAHNHDRACSVIELTDSDTSLSTKPTAVPVTSSSTKKQIKPPQDIQADYDEGVPVRTLDVNRFTFPDPICKKSGASTSKPASRATSAPSTQSRRATSKPAENKVDILPSDLDKILRCISCDAEWTTRKSSVQKLNHIRTCAKKHYLDKETVNVLVQQAVAKYTPPVPGKGKGKEVLPKEPLTKATFYEEVLGDAAPKKRTKRQVAQTSLTNVSANRDDILARAQNVLKAAPSMTPATHITRDTTADHDNTHFHQQSPLRTQHFGTSLLAQARPRTATKSLFEAIYSSPPAAHTSTMTSPETRNTPSKGDGLVAQFNQGDNDDISPLNDIPSNVNLYDVFKGPSLARSDRQDELSDVALSNNEEDIVITPAKTRKRPAKPKTPKPPKVLPVALEEEWESYMKESIMKDDQLYMRVLRYEVSLLSLSFSVNLASWHMSQATDPHF